MSKPVGVSSAFRTTIDVSFHRLQHWIGTNAFVYLTKISDEALYQHPRRWQSNSNVHLS